MQTDVISICVVRVFHFAAGIRFVYVSLYLYFLLLSMCKGAKVVQQLSVASKTLQELGCSSHASISSVWVSHRDWEEAWNT